MPADKAQSSDEILRNELGEIHWGPAAGFEDGVLALVDRTSIVHRHFVYRDRRRARVEFARVNAPAAIG